MKISEYIKETSALYQTAENEKDTKRLLELLDVAELRMSDVYIWYLNGLNEEDDVPEAPMRLLFPNFDAV